MKADGSPSGNESPECQKWKTALDRMMIQFMNVIKPASGEEVRGRGRWIEEFQIQMLGHGWGASRRGEATGEEGTFGSSEGSPGQCVWPLSLRARCLHGLVPAPRSVPVAWEGDAIFLLFWRAGSTNYSPCGATAILLLHRTIRPASWNLCGCLRVSRLILFTMHQWDCRALLSY